MSHQAPIQGVAIGHEQVFDLGKLEGHRFVQVVETRHRGKCCVPPFKEYTVVSPGTKTAIFKAQEDLDLCCRSGGCLWKRDFDLRVNDGTGKAVYYFYHPRVWCEWCHCCECCNHRMTIYQARPDDRNERGDILGYVESDFKCGCSCVPNFTIRNAERKPTYHVRKDRDCDACECCECLCCCCAMGGKGYVISDGKGVPGGIYHLDEENSSKLAEDAFRLTFPEQSKEHDRVMMLAATILVDYDLYDEPPPKGQVMTEPIVENDPRSSNHTVHH
eukprot:gb/GEZN01010612.1/.p1 GENE.gb/GEZN01010612.1/~~gb/GEZN01010612.1/.p1  ORF type:complete len:274 (-),score=29.18 gb/GEZN01010612.1/:317-1138(-)